METEIGEMLLRLEKRVNYRNGIWLSVEAEKMWSEIDPALYKLPLADFGGQGLRVKNARAQQQKNFETVKTKEKQENSKRAKRIERQSNIKR